MNSAPFVIEQTYQAAPEKVWQALTDSAQMKEWYFDIPGFRPELGFEFTFNGENEGRVFVHLCKITDVIPFKKLQHTWLYQGLDGSSTVTFEIFPEGDQTKLKLTHEGLESFPQDRDFRKENFVQGWTEIIGKQLRNFLEKTADR